MFRIIEPAVHAGQIDQLDGTFVRFGPDERDPLNVPLSTRFDTEMPGGFGPADIVLPRPEGFDPMDVKLFGAMRLYDARSNDTLYEGRITGLPRDSEAITLECEGWSKALEDDKTARFLGVDSSFDNWEGPSVQLRINDIPLNWRAADGEQVPDPTTGAASILTDTELNFVAAQRPEVVTMYNAQGLNIGYVDYAWKLTDSGHLGAVDWIWQVLTAESSEFLNSAFTGDLQAAGPGSGTLTAGIGHSFAFAELYWSAASAVSAPGVRQGVYWTLLNVVGDHGLTLQGSVAAPNTGRGLLVSDMVAYLVGSFAPALRYTTGANGSIGASSFAVPHAAWLEDTTAREMIDQLVPYGGSDLYTLDWYVYDDRTFYLQGPTQHGTTWRVRKDQASQQQSEGPDSARRLNGVKVTYDDGTGTKRSVGPPGSTADSERDDLQDTNPDNPANLDGQRHWELFDAGTTSQEGATLVGQMILRERNVDEWRGSITAIGEAQSDAGIWAPVAQIRAGDRIIVEDAADTRPRRVVQTSYENQTLNASVGALPDHLDTLLARAGIVLTGLL